MDAGAGGPIAETTRLFPFIQSHHLLVATTLPVEHGNVFDRTVLKFIILFIIYYYYLFLLLLFHCRSDIALHKVDQRAYNRHMF